MMFRGSRTRKAWMSRSASFALSRATVALFQSRPRRSAVAGAGGPSSPGWGLSSRASLRPVLAWEPSVRVRDDGPAACMAATRSTRERKPEPSSARPPPLIHRRRPVSMHASFREPARPMAARGAEEDTLSCPLERRTTMAELLPTRPLGRSGLEITTVGFGAWAIGGAGWAFGWGPQDDEASLAAMRRALERGVNWIDTAAVYGLGHSEEVVGRLLRGLPAAERPLVFTKCGLVWAERNRMAQARRVLRPPSIRAECEVSLRRLGVERIDLYQFHWPDETGTPIEDSWAAMARLVDEGKVRAVGVSNFGVDLLERCEAVRHVESLQPPFSLVRRRAAEREIPWW